MRPITRMRAVLRYLISMLQWDEQLCSFFGVPAESLAEVDLRTRCLVTRKIPGCLATVRVPITGVIGDSQAALFGNQCFRIGMAKATYGTGTSVLMNVGDKPAPSKDGLVSAIAWGMGGKITYAVEAVIRTSGDSLKWIRDNLGLVPYIRGNGADA